MITIIIFIIILGVLVFVHELGHFVIARRNGIKADEFGFGFPPRALGIFKNEKKDNWEFVWGAKEIESENTVYSINWIPLGGFVKIKGENGEGKNESDSFASKGAWPRVKVLAAGVIMNFIFAWLLISIVLTVGAPEPIAEGVSSAESKIQITEVLPGSPADVSGIKVGDEVLKMQAQAEFKNVKDFQDYINENKGRELNFEVKRGNELLSIKSVPRESYPEGQGPLGVNLAETVMVKHVWYSAFWKAFLTVFNIIWMMLVALFGIIKSLVTLNGVAADVSGPVGIAVLTKQVTTLGFVYILQFAAFLSINLGIINAIPFPALDGGRILFVLIEKIKGSPVSQKTEQIFHTVGFALLILLMILVTVRDVFKLIK